MQITRKEAREKLLYLVFQYLFLKEKQSMLYDEIFNDKDISEDNKTFIFSTFNGIVENFEDLQTKIFDNVKDFSKSQIFKLDFAILLIASYEIINKTISPAISINEAVNLAKKFSTDKSPSFINGVLASISGEKNGK